MIGKASWFSMRKYGGWGITPKKWQGWFYIFCFIIPFAIFQAMPIWSQDTRLVVTIIWFVVLFMDVFDIMIHLKKSKAEEFNEAICERNASWMIVLVLVIGFLYELIKSGLENQVLINPFIVLALILGSLTKSITMLRLDRKRKKK
jgi:hypothetical protein